MVRPLLYNARLNLQEAGDRYREIKEEFERVKSIYSGIFSSFKTSLDEKDNRTLGDCIGVLLPLGLEASVQQQILSARNPKKALHYEIGTLQCQILDFASEFENTGISKLRY